MKMFFLTKDSMTRRPRDGTLADSVWMGWDRKCSAYAKWHFRPVQYVHSSVLDNVSQKVL